MLRQYAGYNVWANQRIGDAILSLPAAVQVQQMVSSFPGILPTLKHVWTAEYIWWQRIKLQEHIQSLDEGIIDANEIVSGLLKQSKQWEQWVENATEAALQHVFAYRNSKREEFKQPVYEVLLHMFNHATYHRGQVVTMLRQIGVEKIPATDFIEFTRRKK
jgi:uncharacterized damage-inducible protein DinB